MRQVKLTNTRNMIFFLKNDQTLGTKLSFPIKKKPITGNH